MKNIKISEFIKVEILDIDLNFNQIKKEKEISAVQIFTYINNPIIILDGLEVEDIKENIGKCDYRFRKGVGYVGEVHRLVYKGHNSGEYVFLGFSKEKRRLRVNEEKKLTLKKEELKYIYPLVVSSDLKDKFEWSKNYIIFPYKYGEKQPVDKKTLQKEALNLYNYLLENEKKLIEQSCYNKRIQNIKEFYGVIRVGNYTYGNYFVAIRDNTSISPCVVGKIKTDWCEEKNPIFDNHIFYATVDSEDEAKYLCDRLKDHVIEKLVKVMFDERSIGCRFPFKIPKYKKSE